MGFIGNAVKAILIVTVVCWLYLIIEFVVMEQYALALFLFIGLLIPSFIMLYEYRKSKKSEEKNAL
ncbi:MAG: hypothetical protein QW734_02355 [Candidatus Bathyarchaeia archaeon]|nr:hypothetical protein [Candidatus Bathyarchaeota archaeon]